jgi:hypothetical protein
MNDEKMKEEEESNFMEVEVEGIFIKHDFDHFIVDEEEVDKYTLNKLTHSKMKQTLFMPFPYDIQVLVFFLSSHYP